MRLRIAKDSADYTSGQWFHVLLPGVEPNGYARIRSLMIEGNTSTVTGATNPHMLATFASDVSSSNVDESGFLWTSAINAKAAVFDGVDTFWAVDRRAQEDVDIVVAVDALYFNVTGSGPLDNATFAVTIEYERVSLTETEKTLLAFDRSAVF